MRRNRFRQRFLEIVGLIQRGHFIFTAGAHSGHYFEKMLLLLDPEMVDEMASAIAHRFVGLGIETVVGPESGGSILCGPVALHLGRLEERQVHSVVAKKADKGFVFSQTAQLYLKKRRVLIVDDVLTVGSSIRKVSSALRKFQAEVVGAAVILNRGQVRAKKLCLPKLYCLARIFLPHWSARRCPLCRKGVPISTHLGHGKA